MIKDIRGRLILNSRGQTTTEVEAITQKGVFRAAAPSGASKGALEAPELDPKSALKALEKFKPQILNMDEKEIDDFIQANIKELGRAGVALSFALFRTKPLKIETFPYPLGNILGGGKHGGGTDIQEFLISPKKSSNIQEAVFTNAAAHSELKSRLKKIDPSFRGARNDEGGWVCGLKSEKALETLSKLGEEFGVQVGLDMAATSMWDGKNYVYEMEKKRFSPDEHVDYVLELIKTYNLFYVEDPMEETDFKGLAEITRKAPKNCMICGDDTFVTNVEQLQKGINRGAANALIIKPNQVGTIGAAWKTVQLAKKHGYRIIVSHRSGETEDPTLARVALAFKADLIKCGIVNGERIAKLNELIRLWTPTSRMVK